MNADCGKTERALHGSFTAELELPALPGDVLAAYAARLQLNGLPAALGSDPAPIW
jgi:hypothetical protein